MAKPCVFTRSSFKGESSCHTTRELASAIAELTNPNQLDLNFDEPKKRVTYNVASREKGVPSKRADNTKRVPLNLRTLEGALLVIRNLGYTYVVEKAGDTSEVYKHGTLTSIEAVKPAKAAKKRKAFRYEKGYLKSFVEPQMRNMKVGELLEISNQHPDGTSHIVVLVAVSRKQCGGQFLGVWFCDYVNEPQE
jgi:hypothetical protein